MDKDFENLIDKAKEIAIKKELSEYASCGHIRNVYNKRIIRL